MAVVTATGKGIQTRQLIINGDNESALASIDGATPSARGSVIQYSPASPDSAHGGVKVLKYAGDGTVASSGYYAPTGNNPSLFRLGARYICTGWLFIPSWSTATRATLRMTFNSTLIVDSALVTQKASWQYVAIDCVAPVVQTSTVWNILCYVTGDISLSTTVVYFDDLSLVEYSGGGIIACPISVSGDGLRGAAGSIRAAVPSPGARTEAQTGATGSVSALLSGLSGGSFSGLRGITGRLRALVEAPLVRTEGDRWVQGRLRGSLPSPSGSAWSQVGILGRLEARLPFAGVRVRGNGSTRWHTAEEDESMHQLKRGSTSVILSVEMRLTDGTPATGLTADAVTAAYVREGQGDAAVSVALSSGVAGEYLSGGWCEVDASGAPGIYQFGVPSSALAAGARSVAFRFSASGCFAKTVQALLLGVDPYDSVRAGLAALPNASAGGEGGVPVLSAGLEVAATVAAPGTLTAAYDAAKTAASASAVTAVGAAVAAVAEDVTALAGTDVPAVQTAVDAVGLALEALVTAVGALEDLSASDAAAGILAGVVDGTQTVRDVLERLNDYLAVVIELNSSSS